LGLKANVVKSEASVGGKHHEQRSKRHKWRRSEEIERGLKQVNKKSRATFHVERLPNSGLATRRLKKKTSKTMTRGRKKNCCCGGNLGVSMGEISTGGGKRVLLGPRRADVWDY